MTEKLTQAKLDEMVLKELELEAPQNKTRPSIKELLDITAKKRISEVASR